MDAESVFLQKLSKGSKPYHIQELNYDLPAYFYPTQQHLDKYISQYLQHMRPAYLTLLNKESFQPINHVSIDPFYTFGMVLSPTGSKPDTQLYLFNSEDGSNVSVKLDLSALTNYTLVSGQIIAVKARNPSGNELLVDKIYSHPILKQSTLPKSNIRIAIFGGPFDIHRIEKIKELVKSQECGSLILLGPFNNLNDDSLMDALSHINNCSIMIVPSIDDVGTIKVIPQPKFTNNSDKLVFLSNPSTLLINNHLISVINYDILEMCKNMELYKPSNKLDDLVVPGELSTRMFQHLVFSRSFLPVFPSIPNLVYGPWACMDASPDILIVKSSVECFASKVGSVLCLNIGTSFEEGAIIEGCVINGECVEYKRTKVNYSASQVSYQPK